MSDGPRELITANPHATSWYDLDLPGSSTDVHLQLPTYPQFPALRERATGLLHRHVGATHRAGLAGVEHHRQPDRGRYHHRIAVPAHAVVRPDRRRDRRPLPEAPRAAGDPGRHVSDGRGPRGADALAPGPGLARLPDRVRARHRDRRREPDPAVLRERDGR